MSIKMDTLSLLISEYFRQTELKFAVFMVTSFVLRGGLRTLVMLGWQFSRYIIKKNCSYASIGDDISLNVGRNVYGISHSLIFEFTFLIGYLVSGLVTVDELRIDLPELDSYIRNFNDDIQFMRIAGFVNSFEELHILRSLGSPIFNSRGAVIGMNIGRNNGYDYAVSASSLKKKIRLAKVPYTAEGSSGEGSSGAM